MSKYSWASFVCLRFISICRNTCMHAQERSSWALIIQIARDSSFCQVLRGFSGWNHLRQCGLRGKKWSLSLSRLWHSFSVSNGWLLPDYSHGQSCYWSATSFHELRPNHTCCLDCYVNSYGWLGLWKDLALRVNPAKSALEAMAGLKLLFLSHNRPHRLFISGMWKFKLWLHKVLVICRKYSKKMRPFIDELFRLTESVCLLTRCSHHLEHRSVFYMEELNFTKEQQTLRLYIFPRSLG